VAEELKGSFHPCNVMDEANVDPRWPNAIAGIGGKVHIGINTAGGGIASAR